MFNVVTIDGGETLYLKTTSGEIPLLQSNAVPGMAKADRRLKFLRQATDVAMNRAEAQEYYTRIQAWISYGTLRLKEERKAFQAKVLATQHQMRAEAQVAAIKRILDQHICGSNGFGDCMGTCPACEKAKAPVSQPWSCDHANEVPVDCPCPASCLCRTIGSCATGRMSATKENVANTPKPSPNLDAQVAGVLTRTAEMRTRLGRRIRSITWTPGHGMTLQAKLPRDVKFLGVTSEGGLPVVSYQQQVGDSDEISVDFVMFHESSVPSIGNHLGTVSVGGRVVHVYTTHEACKP